MVGAKLLWWTWHDSDSAFEHRWLHVPLASNLFVLTQCWSWATLLRVGLDRIAAARRRNAGPGTTSGVDGTGPVTVAEAVSVLWLCCWTVPGMLLMLPLVQVVASLGTVPPPSTDFAALVFAVTALVMGGVASLAASGWRKYPEAPGGGSDEEGGGLGWLAAVGVVHFGTLALTATQFDSAAQASTGVHQTVGDCAAKERDFAGERFTYICPEQHGARWADFRLGGCGAGAVDPSNGGPASQWYTVCGTQMSPAWRADALAIIGGCSVAFAVALGVAAGCAPPRDPQHNTTKKHD